MIPIRTCAAVALVLSPALAAQDRQPLPSPDPTLQASLRDLLAAESAAEQRRALEELRAQAGARHERLVPQLFLLLRGARDTREAMLFGSLVETLPIPDEHVVGALVPLLEGADRPLREALGNVLSGYEDRSLDRGASFTVYRPLLEGELPPGLVRYLFETDPDAALLAVTRAQTREPSELRALLWAQHELADARWKLRFGFLAPDELARRAPGALEELAALARHPRWWARLYAAEVARQEPALRSAVPSEELRRDEHALVREVAAELPEAR